MKKNWFLLTLAFMGILFEGTLFFYHPTLALRDSYLAFFSFIVGSVLFLIALVSFGVRRLRTPFLCAVGLWITSWTGLASFLLLEGWITSLLPLPMAWEPLNTFFQLLMIFSFLLAFVLPPIPPESAEKKLDRFIGGWVVMCAILAVFLGAVALKTRGFSFLAEVRSFHLITLGLLFLVTLMGLVRGYVKKYSGPFGMALVLALFLLLIANALEAWPGSEPFLKTMGVSIRLLALVVALTGVVLESLDLAHKDREALFLLAETQGMLAERKNQLEQANKRLLKSNQEFISANEKISLIIDTANDAFIALDSNGMVTEWNRQAEVMMGWQRDEAVGKKLISIILPDDYRQQLEADIRGFFTGGKSPVINRQIEVKALHRDGHEFPVELSISILKNPEGYSFNTFVRDISARKKAEEELAHRAQDLARSNQELEQFAYVASHDLQEPLRMVASYTQLLAKRYKGKLDTNADEFIQYAVEGVTRMQQLINDLLEYSRVGRKGKELRQVSLEYSLQGALANLQIAIKESAAQVTHDSLPVVMADDTQMVQLFQNLVGNAIKFRGEKNPEIHVGVVSRSNDWLFSVKDNGIGIDPQYSERIFVIFQRLHGQKEYSGTGIGLAVCKKIVERHGGKIWIESALGQGTTFYFTIPRQKETIVA